MRGMRTVFVLALAACAHLPARDAASDESRIRARLARWVEQFNSGDYVGAAGVWAPDLIGVIPGEPDDSYPREIEGARRAKPGPVRFALTVDEVLVDGDLAVVRDTWVQTGNGRDQKFRSFEVWRRQPDGEWKIARWIDAAPEPRAP
jgi:ketosteroid isomerase-like protein